MEIVKAPAPVLSESAKQITTVDESIRRLVAEMTTTLLHTKDPVGVGLAAPQVGKSLQLFIVKQSASSPVLTFINPVVEPLSSLPEPLGEDESTKLEGCLSLKDIWGEVRRYPKIKVSYLDENGKKHTKTVSGFLSTIIQHETDHLHGILFPKRVLEQKGQLYKSHKNEKNEDEFEELDIV